MESQSELVGGEQNNQTAKPLVADENDQNVKSQAGGNKRKSPGTDKKCRAKKKQKTEDTERQLEETRSENDELKKKLAYANGKLDQAQKDMELITGGSSRELIKQVAERQNAIQKKNDEYFKKMTELIRGLEERRRQNASPVAGRAGFGIPRPFDFHHPATGSTMELGVPDIQESLCPSHEVERAHRNTVDQPALSYDAMASGSSPMQGSLAPGGPARLSFDQVTGFGTGETGLPVQHPPVHQFGTTMGSGGLAVEDSPGLPQSELPQVWTHLPMPDTSFLNDDWIEDQYNAPTRMS